MRPHRGRHPSRGHDRTRSLIQRGCYREVRDTFGLSANLAIRAIARVCAALKVPERADSDVPADVDRLRRPHLLVPRVGLDRQPDAAPTPASGSRPMPGEHQKRVLKGTKPTAAQLVKRDGGFFLHIQLGGRSPRADRARPTSSAWTWASPGSPPRATSPKGTAASPSRRSAASTTSSGSDSSGKGPRERRRSCRRICRQGSPVPQAREPLHQQDDRPVRQRHRTRHRP